MVIFPKFVEFQSQVCNQFVAAIRRGKELMHLAFAGLQQRSHIASCTSTKVSESGMPVIPEENLSLVFWFLLFALLNIVPDGTRNFSPGWRKFPSAEPADHDDMVADASKAQKTSCEPSGFGPEIAAESSPACESNEDQSSPLAKALEKKRSAICSFVPTNLRFISGESKTSKHQSIAIR